MNTAVVFWSSTGNTEAMAGYVAEGIREAGGQAELISAADFTPQMVEKYDAFAFGCPAMGAEVLEEEEFQPMWDSVKDSLGGKPVCLFGSYGWGDGEWMETWKSEAPCAILDTYICQETPGSAEADACRALGRKLA